MIRCALLSQFRAAVFFYNLNGFIIVKLFNLKKCQREAILGSVRKFIGQYSLGSASDPIEKDLNWSIKTARRKRNSSCGITGCGSLSLSGLWFESYTFNTAWVHLFILSTSVVQIQNWRVLLRRS